MAVVASCKAGTFSACCRKSSMGFAVVAAEIRLQPCQCSSTRIPKQPGQCQIDTGYSPPRALVAVPHCQRFGWSIHPAHCPRNCWETIRWAPPGCNDSRTKETCCRPPTVVRRCLRSRVPQTQTRPRCKSTLNRFPANNLPCRAATRHQSIRCRSPSRCPG